MDDFALVRPTIVASFPRFWTLLYNQYLHALYEAYTAYLADSANGAKNSDSLLQRDGSDAHESREGEVGASQTSKTEPSSDACPSTEVGRAKVEDEEVVVATGAGEVESQALSASRPENDLTSAANTRDSDIQGTVTQNGESFGGDGDGKEMQNTDSFETASDSGLDIAPTDFTEDDTELQLMIDASSPPPTPSNFNPDSVPFSIVEEVREQFRSILGGREKVVSTGGAPTGEAVKKFMMRCFNGLPQEGYGTTEVWT